MGRKYILCPLSLKFVCIFPRELIYIVFRSICFICVGPLYTSILQFSNRNGRRIYIFILRNNESKRLIAQLSHDLVDTRVPMSFVRNLWSKNPFLVKSSLKKNPTINQYKTHIKTGVNRKTSLKRSLRRAWTEHAVKANITIKNCSRAEIIIFALQRKWIKLEKQKHF